MREFFTFSNPLFASIFSVICTVIVAFIFHKISSRNKKLTIININITKLINTTKLGEKLKLFYNKTEVINPYLYSFYFENSGKKEIRKSDFDTSLKIEFSEDVKILDYNIAQCNNVDLEKSISECGMLSNNMFELSGILLNPKDSFVLNLILDNHSDITKISHRIAGIAAISSSKRINSLGYLVIKNLMVNFLGVNLSSLFEIIGSSRIKKGD